MDDQPDEVRLKHEPLQRVAWTRGGGCADAANLLAGGTAMRIEGDLRTTCVRERIDALVSRKLSSFDLVPVIVPQSVDFENVERVTAAVGGGPHSPFAVAVAARGWVSRWAFRQWHRRSTGSPIPGSRRRGDSSRSLHRFRRSRPAQYAETAPCT